jgi:hypothetical protein
VAADLRLVTDAADRDPDELAADGARDRLPERRLTDAGGPTKQRIGPETSFFSFETARYSRIRSLTFSRS